MNHTRLIQFCFGLLFCIIAISSFALSYLNLMEAAIEAGISPMLAWMWPLCIDSFIIMGSLFILMASIRSQPIWQGWVTVISFTLVSVTFNIIHSPADLFSRAAHAVAPVALCGSLEMLMLQLKRDLLRCSDESVDYSTVSSNLENQPHKYLDEKQLKVYNYFTEFPNRDIEPARKDLKMNWSTVRGIRSDLIQLGLLQKRPDE